MMTEQEWIDDVHGRPWVENACGPDAFDCRGLVFDYFRRVRGVEMPDMMAGWREVYDLVAGRIFDPCEIESAIMFTAFNGDDARHVGILVGGKVVHAIGTPDAGGQVYVHTLTQVRRIYARDKLEFWKCR